jgi:hypothetical protein
LIAVDRLVCRFNLLAGLAHDVFYVSDVYMLFIS